MKRTIQVKWTGRSSPPRVHSRVFFQSAAFSAGKFALEKAIRPQRLNLVAEQHPRRIDPAWSGFVGVFSFLGGA